MDRPTDRTGRWATSRAAASLALLLCAALGCPQDFRAGNSDGSGDDTSDAADRVDSSDEAGSTADDVDAAETGPPADTTDAGGDADTGRHRGPPYPIVLAHGFGGFEHLADVEELEYFYEVPQLLRADGEVVMVAEVDPFDDSYKRGRQLLRQIEKFTAEHGWRKVHIVGHSQGGLDARYVAHHRPGLVASVVTISTPHEGTRVADIALRIVEYDNAQEIIEEVAELVGRELYDKSGKETDVVEALRQFSEPGIEKFNKRITDQPEVYYASIAGRSGLLLGVPECDTSNEPKFIEDWEYETDPIDPALSATEAVLDGSTGSDANDGMVRVDKAKWGEFLGCVPADHLDEVGQLLGDHPGGFNDWRYRVFYRRLADFLHDNE